MGRKEEREGNKEDGKEGGREGKERGGKKGGRKGEEMDGLDQIISKQCPPPLSHFNDIIVNIIVNKDQIQTEQETLK